MKFARFSTLRGWFLLVGAVLMVAGCETEGPAEKAGERIDKQVEETKDALDPRGPAEKAGDSIDRGVQNLKDAVDPPGPAERAGRAVDEAAKP